MGACRDWGVQGRGEVAHGPFLDVLNANRCCLVRPIMKDSYTGLLRTWLLLEYIV